MPIPSEFWGVPLEQDVSFGAPMGKDPKPIIHAITFEVTQHLRLWCMPQRYRQTDDILIAIPRNAHSAPRGKNDKFSVGLVNRCRTTDPNQNRDKYISHNCICCCYRHSTVINAVSHNFLHEFIRVGSRASCSF